VVRGGGAGQGEGGGTSPRMAGDGEGGSAADMVAVQWRRGTPVVVGGSSGVLEHEGEEKKVRGMATWPERLRRRRSPEGREDDGGGDNPGGGSSVEEQKGVRGRCSATGERRGERKKWSVAVSAPF
jgi:hypothetical protein